MTSGHVQAQIRLDTRSSLLPETDGRGDESFWVHPSCTLSARLYREDWYICEVCIKKTVTYAWAGQ